MTHPMIAQIEAPQLKTDLPRVNIGDTVDVHTRIIEGDKERIQIFSGVVIAMKGHGITKVITVRRIVANEGVERIIPVNSPRVAKIEVVRQGHARRAKLFYLRDRVGKSRRLRDKRRGLKHGIETPGSADSAPAAE
ncbi:MAG: 50S ribosomal protein L19 [Planctomycetes bacterium]|nr:50S ribosomal protein L19 [Planctomycetota bacterium]